MTAALTAEITCGIRSRHLSQRRRLTIDNGPAEQAVQPLAVGAKNWLHLGGDGALRPTALPLSGATSARRHGINPWAYLKDVLTELPVRSPDTDLTDLLPDV